MYVASRILKLGNHGSESHHESGLGISPKSQLSHFPLAPGCGGTSFGGYCMESHWSLARPLMGYSRCPTMGYVMKTPVLRNEFKGLNSEVMTCVHILLHAWRHRNKAPPCWPWFAMWWSNGYICAWRCLVSWRKEVGTMRGVAMHNYYHRFTTFVLWIYNTPGLCFV